MRCIVFQEIERKSGRLTTFTGRNGLDRIIRTRVGFSGVSAHPLYILWQCKRTQKIQLHAPGNMTGSFGVCHSNLNLQGSAFPTSVIQSHANDSDNRKTVLWILQMRRGP